MLALDTIRVLRYGKKNETTTNTNMSEISSSENNPAVNCRDNDVSSVAEARVFCSRGRQ